MKKIKMTTPLVEMDGDEMTRVLWRLIKDELILPFVELKTEYYDLGLLNRNETRDQVTIDAAVATQKYGVAVKCATITPNRQRMEEYPQLTEMWNSPNGTIRALLDGTVFRAPILIDAIKPAVKNWKKPITIARHAYGDVYRGIDFKTDEPGETTMTFRGLSGKKQRFSVQKTDGPAIWQGAHNKEASIRSFARACFQYAVATRQDLWFSTKDTIAKVYDGFFKTIFEEVFQEYKDKFAALGLEYFYTLIDDAIARVIRSEGGYIWACKNYDGDVMSDMVSTAFGSLAMMTSVLASPDGKFEYEAAHGTVTRHYYKYMKGEETSTNPVATIFAWSGGLRKRGELDALDDLIKFADALEQACLDCLNAGIMTKDLASLVEPGIQARGVSSRDFLAEIRARLELSLNCCHAISSALAMRL
ncbi:MAG: NADP-dependent isocitrate dehydrogenase [Desulfovibrionaceae bacterium]|nr:NADP-dependent isocitrate dehydrogenase [Desulfovibrionaceae bacterium]